MAFTTLSASNHTRILSQTGGVKPLWVFPAWKDQTWAVDSAPCRAALSSLPLQANHDKHNRVCYTNPPGAKSQRTILQHRKEHHG